MANHLFKSKKKNDDLFFLKFTINTKTHWVTMGLFGFRLVSLG